jgi:hypothetical protein
MNAALFTKSTTGLILATGLIAASSVLASAQDAPVALGAPATIALSTVYATVPTGQASLGGHTFDVTSGNMLQLVNGGSASFTGSYQKPTAVHLLLNTANTSNMFAGTTVANVVLTFSDATTQVADVIVGSNVREWRISAFGVVNTVTDTAPSTTNPYTTQGVWTTTALAGGTAVIDMVTVPVLAANTSKTLTGIQLNDVNGWGSIQIDLAGLTVEFTPPAPPTPTPTPTPTPGGTGSGNETGNHDGDHRNTDKSAPIAKKAVTKEKSAQNNNDQHSDGNANRHRNGSD